MPGRIEALVWNEFAGNIRVLLDNPYIFRDFWQHQTGQLSETDWKRNFTYAKAAAGRALARRDGANNLGQFVALVIEIMMDNAG